MRVILTLACACIGGDRECIPFFSSLKWQTPLSCAHAWPRAWYNSYLAAACTNQWAWHRKHLLNSYFRTSTWVKLVTPIQKNYSYCNLLKHVLSHPAPKWYHQVLILQCKKHKQIDNTMYAQCKVGTNLSLHEFYQYRTSEAIVHTSKRNWLSDCLSNCSELHTSETVLSMSMVVSGICKFTKIVRVCRRSLASQTLSAPQHPSLSGSVILALGLYF